MIYLVSFTVDLSYEFHIRISYIDLKFYAQNIKKNIFFSSFYSFFTLFFTSFTFLGVLSNLTFIV